ncbi:class I SAM-dependent methyltransferase [Streptomyces sp. NPDC049954]|uniref:class I SAM-dependent methyltransferase n=1 Tax=Streptomyces sp. NPDC049954 TaxID=3155779 RepID=UPI003442976C
MTDTLAWNTYSRTRPQRRAVNAAGQSTWFNWTQYPDHGPGVELLNLTKGDTVLDLGCGKGGNIAHLATLGTQSTGIDISPAQLDAAGTRWNDTPGLTLTQAEAHTFLRGTEERWNAVYSVFGVMWFTDPAVTLPLVRERLHPGGVLAFSQRPPTPDCYGCQASYIPRGDDEDPLVVKRWDYEPETWQEMLHAAGYSDATARVLPAPPGRRKVGTLIVTARA